MLGESTSLAYLITVQCPVNLYFYFLFVSFLEQTNAAIIYAPNMKPNKPPIVKAIVDTDIDSAIFVTSRMSIS